MTNLEKELNSAEEDLRKPQTAETKKETKKESKKEDHELEGEGEANSSSLPTLKESDEPELSTSSLVESNSSSIPSSSAKSNDDDEFSGSVKSVPEEKEKEKEEEKLETSSAISESASSSSVSAENDDAVKEEPAITEDTSNTGSSDTASTETNDISLLQLSIPDEMNSVEDDDSSAPVNMMMKRHQTILAQNAVSRKTGASLDDSGFTFGARTDGSGRTFDINENGQIVYPPPATEEDEFLKAVAQKGADAKERIDPPLNSTEAMDGSNVVCVCKRHGAPRGFDRIRCKRNPTPTPAPPAPTPKPPPSIKQCANGTWTAGTDKGTSDVICIYFPADPVKVTPPIPAVPEPQYPAECYDPRNEWVAEGVQQSTRDKVDMQLLIQSGYETCGC